MTSGAQFTCPDCRRSFPPEVVLGGIEWSMPAGPWFFGACPACGRGWVLEVLPDQLCLGDLDEFPPHLDSFIPLQEIPLPGIRLEVAAAGLRIHWQGTTWVFP